MALQALQPYEKGSSSFSAKFPSVFAQGTKPMDCDLMPQGEGKVGEPRQASIIATGKFGGSRSMGVGADTNPNRKVSGGRAQSSRKM